MTNTHERIAALSPEKRALLAKRRGETTDTTRTIVAEPIAIIGIGCRFPGGATTPEAFWELLVNGVDAITEVPPERWNLEALYDPDPDAPGKLSTRWGGFVDQVEGFDAAFFGIAPREALAMDPQQRLFLEVAWEALERAGQPLERITGSRTGVFAGVIGSDYHSLLITDTNQINEYTGTGSSHSIVTGRLSYLLDLRGPSIPVDTACSSSLVAVHLAVQCLRNRDCNMALAGGVNLMLIPEGTICASKMHIMAPDGRCKTFDAHANGFVRGEGCGVVVLKRLSDALNDGDPILALIRGTAVNQDGRSAGLTAPSMLAQKEVIQQALANGNADPAQIGYVEAHGTGTPLGDPIEVEALAQVYGKPRPDGQTCALGSVKTNIGHLEGAAGIAGLLRTVLAIQHGIIPPHLHLRTLNPNISLTGTPFVIPTSPQPWGVKGGRRLAGVSSFGWAGTNAHIVLEEAPSLAAVSEPDVERSYLIPLAARSPEALTALALQYQNYIGINSDLTLRDLAYTTALRRSHHDHRLTLVARTLDDVAEGLQAFLNDEPFAGLGVGRKNLEQPSGVVFVFPGQGGQWLGMGRRLLQGEPVFRETLSRCATAFRAFVDWNAVELLQEDDPAWLEDIAIVQPLTCAVQIALAALWQHWGITPTAVVGHSMGEVAAAYTAGALSLDDAARIICLRSQLLRRVRGNGAMAVVDLPQTEAAATIAAEATSLAVAVSNSSRSTVLAGDPDALERILQQLEARNIFCRRIKVDVASHSPQMDPLLPELRTLLQPLRPQPSRLLMLSTVTGEPCNGLPLDADYWVRNLRQPVLFATAVARLAAEGHTTFLELSPHPLLVQAIEQGLTAQRISGLALGSLRREEDEQTNLLSSLGVLYCAGYAPAWEQIAPTKGQCVPLPTYPWQHERFWPEPSTSPRRTSAAYAGRNGTDGDEHPLLGWHIASAVQPGTHLWQQEIGLHTAAYLVDHRVQNLVVLPGAAYIELALAAAAQTGGTGSHVVEDMVFQQALVLPETGAISVQTTLVKEGTDRAAFQVFSLPGKADDQAQWMLHAQCAVRLNASVSDIASPLESDIETVRSRCTDTIDRADYYAAMRERGLDFGPAFQGFSRLWRRDGEAMAYLELPAALAADTARYHVHPAMLDACFQLLGASLPLKDPRIPQGVIFLPISIGRLTQVCQPGRRHLGYARLHSIDDPLNGFTGDAFLLDEEGSVVLAAEGLRLHPVSEGALAARKLTVSDWMYMLEWQPQALQLAATPSVAGTWLLFADQQGVARAVCDALTAQGATCVLVVPGETWQHPEPGVYMLPPTDPEGFTHLLDNVLNNEETDLCGIVHLWSLDIASPDATTLHSLGTARHLGCDSVLLLVQALMETGMSDLPRLWLVTSGVQCVTSTPELTNPAQAPLWGMGRGIDREHPELHCSRIDLCHTDPLADSAGLVAELLASTPENEIALRAGRRFVARLVRLPDSLAQLPNQERGPLCREDGTYLITGGLGGIGLAVAAWLVEQGARHLVLIGRRGVCSDAARDTIDRLQQLGAQVVVLQADVADAARMQEVLATIRQSMPPLRGIHHAAGVLDDGIILRQDPARFARVMLPKMEGAWLLHTATRQDPLDSFVMYSSVAAVLGSPGQSNHSAANAYLDALAHARWAQGLPALSINWGPWAEIGAAAQPGHSEHVRQTEIGSLTPIQGLEALERLMRQDVPQASVIPLELRRLTLAYPQASSIPLFANLLKQAVEHAAQQGEDVPEGLSRAELLKLEPEERLRRLQVYIVDRIARVMGFARSKINVQEPLSKMGLDSLMTVKLQTLLETSLGVRVPVAYFFKSPSIVQLTADVLTLYLGDSDATEQEAQKGQERAMTRRASASRRKDAREKLRAMRQHSSGEDSE